MVHKFELGTNQNPAHKFPQRFPQRFPFVALVTSLTLAACSCLFMPYGAEAADTTVDQAIVKAAMARQQKKTDEAMRVLAAVESKAGKSAGFYAERAANYIDKGNLESALADCDRSLKINPKMSDAHDRKAYCLAVKGNTLAAIGEYSTVIKLNPQSPKPYYNRAMAYKKLGKLELAGKDLQQFDKLSGKLVAREQESAVLEAVHKQVREGNRATAIEALESANKSFPMAGLAYNLGLLYRDSNNYPRALKAFAQAIELGIKDQEKTSSAAFAYLDRGMLLAKLGKYKDALRDFTSLIALADKGHPVNSVNSLLKEYRKLALGERARTYVMLKEPDKALADCNQLIALNPKAGLAYQIRSAIYKVQKKDALAKADEAKAKKFGATAAIDTSLLLSSPEAAYRKAYEQLTQIIKEHPAEMHPYNERAFLSLNAKYYKAAIEDFNVILKKTPQDVKALLGRGQCYFFLSDYASAGDDFDKALAVDPQKSYAAHTWKARIKEKLSPREDHSGVRAD